MDNGQPAKSDSNQPFFTADNGVDTEKNHTHEDNLDSNNWDISTNRDPRGIGNTAINSPEINPDSTPGETPVDHQKLGEIVNMAMPPGAVPENTPVTTNQDSNPAIDFTEIKTEEKLNPKAIRKAESRINQLAKDGDIASFYDDIRGENSLTSHHLKNSFGREIGKEA